MRHGDRRGREPALRGRAPVELDVDEGIVRDVRFNGRGCAISQAAASMISDVVKGKTVAEVAALGRDDVLEELGIPLTPDPAQVRAALGERAQGRPRADAGRRRARSSGDRVAAGRAIPEGGVRSSSPARSSSALPHRRGPYAIEDRCSHDDGPLCEGEREGFCVCAPPRRQFDLRTGAVLSLPATEDVEAFPVVVRDGEVFVVA